MSVPPLRLPDEPIDYLRRIYREVRLTRLIIAWTLGVVVALILLNLVLHFLVAAGVFSAP